MHLKRYITENSDDSLKLYFKEVSKFPLLTKEQELDLAYKIRDGNSKAINKLIQSNLRFAIAVAKQYQGHGLPLVDLIQIANEGLIYSAHKYNPDMGNKFISFAVWHIRQHLTRALSNQSRTVRLPISHIQTVAKIRKITNKYLQEHERIPSQSELEEQMTESSERIRVGLSTPNSAVSFDSPLKEIDGGTLLDITPSNMFEVTDKQLMQDESKRMVSAILNKLPTRSSDILRLTFGIDTEQFSLEEIGKFYGIGSERVRQINQKSIKQIQKRFKNLEMYLK